MIPPRSSVIGLLLSGPPALLLIYYLNQQSQSDSAPVSSVTSSVASPDEDSPSSWPPRVQPPSPPSISPSPSLPPADYLPPVRKATTQSSSIFLDSYSPEIESTLEQLPEWSSSPVEESVSFSEADLATVSPTIASTDALVVEVSPPSSAMLAMMQPVDLTSQGVQGLEQNEGVGETAPTLNNSTSLNFGETEPVRQQLLIEPVNLARYQPQRVVGAPASTISTPTAFGADWGRIYAGVALVNRGRGNTDADGSATIGFGLGDAREAIGLDVATNIISLSTNGGQDAFAGSGSVDLKVHRILPGDVGLAVGWENALAWGEARDVDSSVYGVVSRTFLLQPNNTRNPLPLLLSVGLGGGRFRSAEDIENQEGGVGVFASAGLRVNPQVSLLANWTGQDMNAGVSFIPFPEVPFSLTLAAVDLTGSAGDGVRFGLSLGYGTRFSF